MGLLVMLTTLSALSQEPWQLRIRVTDMPDTLYIYPIDQQTMRLGKADTLVTRKGTASYIKQLDQVTTFLIRSQRGAGRLSLSLPGVPGEVLEITGSMNRPNIGGSAFYQHFSKVMGSVVDPFTTKYDSIYAAMRNGHAKGDSIRQAIDAALFTVDEAKAHKIMQYIDSHPEDEMSGYLITQLRGEKVTEAAGKLALTVREGRMKDIFQPSVDRQKQIAAAKEQEKKIVEGSMAPDFTLEDLNGNMLTLSSLRGRYVVLDFWGSWCVWCLKGMPKMKEYYQKYKDKLEVVGVDCNDTKKNWKSAVEKHSLPWIHVFNTDKSAVNTLYGVQGYPTKIVIDPWGRIVKIVVGERPDFYTYLDALIGGN